MFPYESTTTSGMQIPTQILLKMRKVQFALSKYTNIYVLSQITTAGNWSSKTKKLV